MEAYNWQNFEHNRPGPNYCIPTYLAMLAINIAAEGILCAEHYLKDELSSV